MIRIFALLCSVAWAQITPPPPGVTQKGPTLPATCQVGRLFTLTSGSVGLYVCVTANTWTGPFSTTTGTGDVSSNTSTSVDGEAVLFSGTGGKTIKRSPLTGVMYSTSGVLSAGKSDLLQGPLFCTDAGSTDDYACNLSPAITAYVTGTKYRFKANTSNTGAATLALNGLSALPLKSTVGAITSTLNDNEIQAGQWVDCVYDGTNCQVTSSSGTTVTGANNCATAGQIPFIANTLGKINCSTDLVHSSGQVTIKVDGTPTLTLEQVNATNKNAIVEFKTPGGRQWLWAGGGVPSNTVTSMTATEYTDGSFVAVVLTLKKGGSIGIGNGNTSPVGTLETYDATASTGVTRGWFREGAGQSTSEVFGVYANNGTTKRIDLTNNIFSVTSTLNVVGASFTWNGKTCTLVVATPNCT